MTARDLDAVVADLAGKYGLSDLEASVVRVAFHHLQNTPEDAAIVTGGELGREVRPNGAGRPLARLVVRYPWGEVPGEA